ncbi:MAG: PIN domain-containing protein [Bacteroidetes bacterium]|jgi:predicted nucleic acid-binding protein|nr:PIN domain-containing protein [Bacteroidota bacterium]
MQDIVFDTWPLMALFDNEPSAPEVEKIITDSSRGDFKLSLSVINLGEIWYSYARIFSEPFADELRVKIKAMNFDIISVNWQMTQIAARFKVAGGISYADCFAAALAKSKDAPLVTGDREFEQLKDEIEIIWV